MYPLSPFIGQCPVCNGPLTITRLHCPQCDVTLEGHFTLGRLGLLSPEQLEFVEVYLRCGGKLKAVGELLKLSYPTVRSRLDEVIISMGYELPGAEDDDEPPAPDQRRQVLDDLAAGRITSEEAVRRLQHD